MIKIHALNSRVYIYICIYFVSNNYTSFESTRANVHNLFSLRIKNP